MDARTWRWDQAFPIPRVEEFWCPPGPIPPPPRISIQGYLRDIAAENCTPSELHRSSVGCITSIPSRPPAADRIIADYTGRPSVEDE